MDGVMLNAFLEWLVINWDLIVDIFMWGLTALMGFILIAKVYKIVKFDFEAVDAASLIFVALWFSAIIFFGFNHIRLYLQSFL